MRKLSFLAISLLVASQANALDLAKYPQVFSAGKGVSVQLVPTADDKQALIQISGINHPLDQVVFLADVNERGGEERDYVARLDGGNYNLVQKRSSWGNGSYQLNLPGADSVHLGFDEDASKEAKPAELESLYEQQKKDGVQDKLAKFDREKRQQAYQARLQELDKEVANDCGSKLQTEVDWSAIDDARMKELSVSSFCGEVASQIATLCRNDAAFKSSASGIKAVECRFDKAMKLREKDGRIVFTTEQNAPNQGDFINAFLRNR